MKQYNDLENILAVPEMDMRGREFSKEEVREIYDKVSRETINNIEDLPIKYSFVFDPYNKNSGVAAHFYNLGKDVGGKVLKKPDMAVFKKDLLRSDINFNNFRNEYIAQKVSNLIGIKLPRVYDFVMATEEKTGYRVPMITMRDLGDLKISQIKDDSLKKVAIASFEIEEKSAKKYWTGTPGAMNSFRMDVNLKNSIWVPEEKQAYLIDCGMWGNLK